MLRLKAKLHVSWSTCQELGDAFSSTCGARPRLQVSEQNWKPQWDGQLKLFLASKFNSSIKVMYQLRMAKIISWSSFELYNSRKLN